MVARVTVSPRWVRLVRRVVRHVLGRRRHPPGVRVDVALVGDREIRRLHRRYLGADRATDVLSFPGGAEPGPSRGVRWLGEVVISVDRARAQARRAGHPPAAELALLAAHGVLHLLGYDDRRRTDAARMDRLQRRLLREIGIEVRG
ncbi:MAG: rRNA maturation RNase YbeY [Armatimonadota bacterium]|nr:rRNA maturation RNase YbeY [Armatimonadota bacterium]MDR7437116.1 rRNA maturation RNase YbeY [Armatimonadota bacterium]MDR7472461.1 rRNA maturation RNase YbeY [Armatimonadota bacterium]MDR7506634.1 rRNA maturation RNase YbeY [Armatimonadota bacterium]MDR7509192.1 rRNA maturation RNase YbeY [Armatimonadota bacterium]